MLKIFIIIFVIAVGGGVLIFQNMERPVTPEAAPTDSPVANNSSPSPSISPASSAWPTPNSTPTAIPTPTPLPTVSQPSQGFGGQAGSPAPSPLKTPTPSSSQNNVIWSSVDLTWKPNGNPPPCAEPFKVKTPVDMNLVTAGIWPGQVRGGDYKAHGGFRFNGEGTNNIEVRAPLGSHLIQASQYLEGGEKQYFLIFSVPCGFVYKFDHLRTVVPKLESVLKHLPPPVEDDSRTQYVSPPLWVEAGELLSNSIGVTKNIFIDFGLFDVRKPNDVSPNPQWANQYYADKEFGRYAVCFFDYLPDNHGSIMRALPTGNEGKISDFCK